MGARITLYVDIYMITNEQAFEIVWVPESHFM